MKIPSLAGPDSFGFLRFKSSVCLHLYGFALVAVLAFAPDLLAQTGTRSVGWVVISVDEYRSLRARAFPSERESPSPPVDATLTRVDARNGKLAAQGWTGPSPHPIKLRNRAGRSMMNTTGRGGARR